MGESLVEAPVVENKMGESVASHPLGVSISFGKYENDSLSWEKWSTFSPNKYLEEVGKCSTPGSVAQKKAYFEAHYKKIAAQKAEVVDEEKPTETEPASSSDDQSSPDQSGSTSEEVEQDIESNSVTSSAHFSGPKSDYELRSSVVEESKEALNGISDSRESGYPQEAVSLRDEIIPNRSQDLVEQPVQVVSVRDENIPKRSQDMVEQPLQVEIVSECQNSLMAESREESNGQTNDHEFNSPGEAALVNHESLVLMEQPLQVDIQRGSIPKSEDKNTKLDAKKLLRKVNPTKKERDLMGTKMKTPASPLPKTPQTSTPKVSKPKSASAVMSVAKYSVKKANASSLPRIKNSFAGESKRAGPTSLHLSLSLGSANLNSASTSSLMPNRKSIFMEQMGDKDIVKRAFKTFQNNFNQLRPSNDDKPHDLKQVLTKGSEHRSSTSVVHLKENERARKTAEKINAQRGQPGRKLNSISSDRSLNGDCLNERYVNAASSSVGLKSNERAERRKEFFKKLDEKSNAKEADKRHLSLKLKEDKEAEMKKIRQSLTFKAKPMPDFYRVQGMSRNPSEKDGSKNEVQHRLVSRQ